MDVLLYSLERSAPSIWMRESLSVLAFPTVLALHTVGLALLVGPNAALDLRLLGVAPRVEIRPLVNIFPVMWGGFWLNLATGIALFVAYPTKALTNPLFYLKLGCVAVGIVVLRRLRSLIESVGDGPAVALPQSARRLASLSLAVWLVAIFAGRLLAYTYTTLLTYLDT